MTVKACSYAAGTVVNALATLKGVAFGIDLRTRVTFREEEGLRGFYILQEERLERNAIAEKLMRNSGIEGGIFEVESEIPRGSGLGSSSAFMNVLIAASMKVMGLELDAERMLRANARLSLESGMSYTGAFDDASASLLGGLVFSDNSRMKLYRREALEGEVLILLPEWRRGEVRLGDIRRERENVERAFRLAMRGELKAAMYLNSLHYCTKLGLPIEPVTSVQHLSVNAGLSGNGPSYVAFGEELKEVEEIWESFGKVVKRRLVSVPAEDVVIPESLFTYYST
ncbi:shikimate kinase [Geoglobus sp.]